jgi:DNA-binding CsgD family transcriptional regulator
MKARHRPITSKQRRILYLLADGCLTKEIAALTRISEAGVKKHLESLRARYGVVTRAAVLRAAIENGDVRLGLRQRLGRKANQ